MLGLVTTPNGKSPMELREVPEPEPQRHEAIVAVHAFSLNPASYDPSGTMGTVGSQARTSRVCC